VGSDWRASFGWTSSSERAWKKTRTYTTVDDWQTEIDVVVYEGERAHVDANNSLSRASNVQSRVNQRLM